MNRQRILMTRENDTLDLSGDYEVFAAIDDETGVINQGYYLDRNEWVEFGNPDTVTVTVHPGDRLNNRIPTRSELAMDHAIQALALELPARVWDDVRARWQDVKDQDLT